MGVFAAVFVCACWHDPSIGHRAAALFFPSVPSFVIFLVSAREVIGSAGVVVFVFLYHARRAVCRLGHEFRSALLNYTKTTSQLHHNYITTTSQLHQNYISLHITTTSQLNHNYTIHHNYTTTTPAFTSQLNA